MLFQYFSVFLDNNIAIIDNIAVKIILLDQSILVVKGAAKKSKFQNTKLIKSNEKLEFFFDKNNAHKLTIKLYQTKVYGLQFESAPIIKGFMYANRNEKISNVLDL